MSGVNHKSRKSADRLNKLEANQPGRRTILDQASGRPPRVLIEGPLPAAAAAGVAPVTPRSASGTIATPRTAATRPVVIAIGLRPVILVAIIILIWLCAVATAAATAATCAAPPVPLKKPGLLNSRFRFSQACKSGSELGSGLSHVRQRDNDKRHKPRYARYNCAPHRILLTLRNTLRSHP